MYGNEEVVSKPYKDVTEYNSQIYIKMKKKPYSLRIESFMLWSKRRTGPDDSGVWQPSINETTTVKA